MPDAMQQVESVQKCNSAVRLKWATVGRNLENIKEIATQNLALQRHYSCLSPNDFRDSMKIPQAIVAPVAGQSKSKGEIISKTGEVAPVENGEMKIWEDGKVGKKPRYLIASKSVINLKSDFQHKLLCDGPTFTAGHACSFSCAFCYVEALMRKNANLNALLEFKGLKHEQVVVEIDDPVAAVREKLLQNGKPLFDDKSDRRVIYGSPLVDVAGTHKQAEVTVAICREILAHTHWQIRLLSKSELLADVAQELSDYKERMIYGFSTGTLEDDITRSFEIGTTSVSNRLKALRQLQNDGYRTFGMLCPILPQADYAEFAANVADKIDLGKVEDVWAEVLNPRGDALFDTSAALRAKKFYAQADLLDRVADDNSEWNKYAEQTFLALAAVVPGKKLHFLQYVEPADYPAWEKHQPRAVLLGTHAKLMAAVEGKDLNFEVITPLSRPQKKALKKTEVVISNNGRQFIKVGRALGIINRWKLYRETHSSFEAYCLAKFDFGRAYGYRLIKAAEVTKKLKGKLSPIGDSLTLLPTTETQTRELLNVDEKHWVRVLQQAAKRADGKRLNALHIQRAAQKFKKNTPSTKGTSFYVPKNYTTDEKTFLSWLEKLRALAVRDEKAELVRLLDKATLEKSILPEMPDMVLIRAVAEIYGALGNMSPHAIDYKRETYLTSEALFQVLRFDGFPEVQEKLQAQKSPMGVKMIAKKHRRLLENPDSDTDLEIMRLCLRLKTEQHDDVKKLLLATGDKVIVEDCSARPRGDAFYWGWANINGQWVGENWLGRLWMDLRSQLHRNNK